MGLVLLMFSLMLLAAALLRLAAGARHERAQPRAGRSGPTGTGRAVLRAVRTVNDVRAMGRGPGAYGKRLARRAVYRSLMKW